MRFITRKVVSRRISAIYKSQRWSNYRIPRTVWSTPRKRGIRGYAVKFDHPSPEFLKCVGEWKRGYAVKFDHPSPEFLECVGEWIRGYADTQWSSTTPPPNFWSVWVSGYADTQCSSTTPPPEFLECVGEWIRGYAVEFDHHSPRIFETSDPAVSQSRSRGRRKN